MGLDIFLLVMDVEEHFGVRLNDERADGINTVGELYTFLLGQTRRSAPTPCPTGRVFYDVRRTFTGEFGVDRKRVRPAARLLDLFPAAGRAAEWPRLAAALGLPELPDPDPPRRLPTARTFGIALAAATLVECLLFPVFLFLPEGEPPLLWWLFIWCGLALLVCEFFGIFWLGAYFKPRTIPRVRDLIVRLTARPRDDAVGPAPAAVWAKLTAILAKHTGTPAQEIRPEHGFYDLVRR